MNLSTLEPGELACRDCGVRVDNPREVEEMISFEREWLMSNGYVHTQREEALTPVSRCPVCTERLQVAQRLVDEHPAVFERLGMAPTPLNIIEAALAGLDALGIFEQATRGLVSTDAQLRHLIQWMPQVGAASRFTANLVPIARVGFTNGPHSSGPGTCSAGRWGHLSTELKLALQEAYVGMLRARHDGPVDVEPPEDGARACLMCGIGTINVLRSRSYNVWGRRYEIEPSTVGGRPMPVPVAGYLCEKDRSLVEQYGVGLTALEHAVIDSMGLTMTIVGDVEIPWLLAWVALPEGTPPHKVPWAHIDTDMLRDQLERVNAGLPPLRIPVGHS